MTNRIDPRYLVVFGACLTQFTVIGVMFAYALFFKDLEAEFGWSRTLLSACMSAAFLVMGILAIVGGRLSDRFGPRWVLAATGITYGLGFVLLSTISEPWHLLLIFGLFVGIGMSTHDVVTLPTVARWFDKRRGVMTGVAKVGTAMGQVIIPPVAAILIINLGWRSASVALGIAAGVLLLIAAMAMKSPPPYEPESGGSRNDHVTFADARRTRVFWTLCAIQFLFFPALMTIPLHIVVHGMDMGMAATTAALLMSVIGGCSIAGRLFIGMLFDRIGGRGAFLLCLVPLIISLISFLFIHSTSQLFMAVTLYGFAHGGLFTVVSPTVAHYFGTRALGTLFGIILFFGTLGGTAGPILTGWLFDVNGNYLLAFGILAGLAVIGLGLALSLPSEVAGRSWKITSTGSSD